MALTLCVLVLVYMSLCVFPSYVQGKELTWAIA